MNKDSLYYFIENPLDNEYFIHQIIQAYTSEGDFYSSVVKFYTSRNKKETGYVSNVYNNDLQLTLYHNWKNSMIESLNNPSLNPSVANTYRLILNYLNRFRPQTAQEVLRIVDPNNVSDSNLRNALCTHCWNQLGQGNFWHHIDSSWVNNHLHRRQHVEHRLYLNCDSSCIQLIAAEFIRRCNRIRSPYYFKYNEEAARDDALVFYCDTEHLPIYINILNGIKRDFKLDNHIYAPTILSGRIYGWLGYGAEDQGPKNISYNDKRCNHLAKCIREQTQETIMSMQDKTMKTSKGEIMSYKQYIIEKMIDSMREFYLDQANTCYDFERAYKFTIQDVLSKEFDTVVRNALLQNYDSIIKNLGYVCPKIEIPFKNGIVRFTSADSDNVLNGQARLLCRISPEYRDNLRERIRRTAKNYDIDPDNYSVDLPHGRLLGKAEGYPRVGYIQPTSNIGNNSYRTGRVSRTGNMIYQNGMNNNYTSGNGYRY